MITKSNKRVRNCYPHLSILKARALKAPSWASQEIYTLVSGTIRRPHLTVHTCLLSFPASCSASAPLRIYSNFCGCMFLSTFKMWARVLLFNSALEVPAERLVNGSHLSDISNKRSLVWVWQDRNWCWVLPYGMLKQGYHMFSWTHRCFSIFIATKGWAVSQAWPQWPGSLGCVSQVTLLWFWLSHLSCWGSVLPLKNDF